MPTTLSAARVNYEPAGAIHARLLPGIDGRNEKNPSTLEEDLRALHPYSLRLRFARNETIFNEGDAASHAYKIISGTVRLCKHTPDGRRQIADFLLPGDIFGILERGEYGFTAEAVTDVILLAYPASQIERLWTSRPDVAKRGFAFLNEHLLKAHSHLVVLGCQNAKERVASFLLRLVERMDVATGERIDLPMGRQDIASHLGLSIETVCRAFADLKRDGAISSASLHQLILRDANALRSLSGWADDL